MLTNHHPQEKDYWNEEIEVENSDGQKQLLKAWLLRIYPENFNSYDAYLDIQMYFPEEPIPDIAKVRSSRLKQSWEVVTEPTKTEIAGFFRGDFDENNPLACVFGLRLIS